MPTIHLEPKLWPGTQQRFFKYVMNNRVARKFMFCAAAQVGKNFVGKWAFIARLIERIGSGIPGEAWILAPDYDLTARAREDFLEVLPKAMLLDYHEETKGPSWYKLLGNVTVFIKSASDPEKIRSKSLFLVLFDELSKVQEAAYLNTLLRLEVEDGTLIATTTPCNSESPWLDELHEKFMDDSDFVWFHCAIEENRMMKPDRIAKLREQFPDEYGQEVLDGRFVKSRTGLVYRNFDGHSWPKGHILEEPYSVAEDDLVICGGDAGTNHPFAFVSVAISQSGFITLFDTIRESDLAPSEQVSRSIGLPWSNKVNQSNTLFVDPAAKYLRAEYQKAGFSARAAKNDVDNGIRSVYALLSARDEKGRPKFRVSRSCQDFIKEIGLYRYQKASNTNVPSTVNKIHDDLCDALRYAWYSHDPTCLGRIVSVSTHSDMEKMLAARRKQSTRAEWDKTEDRLVLVATVPPYMRAKTAKSRNARHWYN